MKAWVVRAFIDKHTRKPYNAGSVYESDAPARIAELQEAGFLRGTPLPVAEPVETAVAGPEENAKRPKRRPKVRKKGAVGDDA